MNKEKPNEQIELARQSGYNEACYVFEKKVEKLKEEFKNFNYEGYYIPKRKKLELQKIIDKIFGSFDNHSPQDKTSSDDGYTENVSVSHGNKTEDTHAKEPEFMWERALREAKELPVTNCPLNKEVGK